MVRLDCSLLPLFSFSPVMMLPSDIEAALRQMEEELQSFLDSLKAFHFSLSGFKEHHGSLLLKIALGESHIQVCASDSWCFGRHQLCT